MKILVDLQGAQTASRYRGIGRYAKAFTKYLIKNAHKNDIFILLNANLNLDIESEFANIIEKHKIIKFFTPNLVSWESESNAKNRYLAEKIREHFINEISPDILVITSLFEGANQCDFVCSIPSEGRKYKIATILYDLIPLLNPSKYLGNPWTHNWYFDKIANLKNSDIFLSISNYSKAEAKKYLELPDSKIFNISSACDSIFLHHNSIVGIESGNLSELEPIKKYIMYNGAFESRKNVASLMRAYAHLDKNIRNNFDLMFVGSISHEIMEGLKALAINLQIENNLKFTGYVDDQRLVYLFKNASLFVLPSLHEGFGLPALEAMACGTATIGSNTTSIPEVIGMPEALFNPNDIFSIADKITQALTDKTFYADLLHNAKTRSSLFSWDSTAQTALSAMEGYLSKQDKDGSPAHTNTIDNYELLVDELLDYNKNTELLTDNDLIVVSNCISKNREIICQFHYSNEINDPIRTIRIEGPFDSSYSLAIVNREIALALAESGYSVQLHSTEGPGDFLPNKKFLESNPKIKELYENSLSNDHSNCDIVARNLYPPRVNDMEGRINILHNYAWEETGFPQEWIEDFNFHLQAVFCTSDHVKKLLIDNGLEIPAFVSGNGVSHWNKIKSDTAYVIEAKKYRILHVSSCFPRKGIQELFEAYGLAFQKNDDVTLIIKTFDNPHNNVKQIYESLNSKSDNYPNVIIVTQDLTCEQLKSLYEQCDVLVAPSKAEGFGLPLAEAMLSGLPVITTNWGGQLDFCNEQTAWLVDFEYEHADSHFNLFNSVWVKPDVSNLAFTMRQVYTAPSELLCQKLENAKALLEEQYSWEKCAQRLVTALPQARASVENNIRIGWVTTWNTKCGIASYSQHILDSLFDNVTIFSNNTTGLVEPDGKDVHRCWSAGLQDSLEKLYCNVIKENINCLIIQINYGLFDFASLNKFINKSVSSNIKVIPFLHSTYDPDEIPTNKLSLLADSLTKCDRVIVHTIADLNRLKNCGVIKNATLFPLGIVNCNEVLAAPHKQKGCFTLSSFGFALPHKGLLELVDAFYILKNKNLNIKLKMINAEYPAPESANVIAHIRDRIKKYKLQDSVSLLSDFLSDEDAILMLKDSDLIVYPYQRTGESASAAVRHGISSTVPVAVTPLSIFDDISPIAFKLPGMSAEEIADGIQRIMMQIRNNDEDFIKKIALATRWRNEHSFSRLAIRLRAIIRSFFQFTEGTSNA